MYSFTIDISCIQHINTRFTESIYLELPQTYSAGYEFLNSYPFYNFRILRPEKHTINVTPHSRAVGNYTLFFIKT